MNDERIFHDEESLTPDAIAADKAAEHLTKLPPFVYALTSISSRLNNGIG